MMREEGLEGHIFAGALMDNWGICFAFHSIDEMLNKEWIVLGVDPNRITWLKIEIEPFDV